MSDLLKSGALAGIVGGLALALFMITVGRGPINEAIALEESTNLAQENDGSSVTNTAAGTRHEEVFTRGVQEVGGAIGLLIFGLGVGLIFAVVLGAVSSSLGASGAFDASLRLGVIGFWTAVVVPFLKVPANPPAVGDPETIGERTILYFAVLLTSVLLTVLVFRLVQRRSRSAVRTGWLGAGAYSAGLLLIFVGLPASPDEINAPAELIWRFRLATVGGLAVLWVAVSLTMGTLLERSAARRAAALMPQPTMSSR